MAEEKKYFVLDAVTSEHECGDLDQILLKLEDGRLTIVHENKSTFHTYRLYEVSKKQTAEHWDCLYIQPETT
ncbi:hypothetical protein HYX16_03230 [Candidatus Woesearchaeota archaeon]|nr:hypothetical protein [Candidatus Woesearchaeota archaeon]